MRSRSKLLTALAMGTGFLFLSLTTINSQAAQGSGFGAGRAGHGGGHGGDHHSRTGGPGHGGLAMHLLRGLDLSDSQKVQAEALVEAQKETAETQRVALHEARKGLHELVLSGTYSDAGAAPFVQQIALASGEMARQHARLGSEIFAMLTPEQRTEMAEKVERMGERGPRRHH